jgi:hypothetical protein
VNRATARRWALVGVLALGAGGCGEEPATPEAPVLEPSVPTLIDTGAEGAAFRAEFARGEGHVRIVALVSPT